MLDRARSQLPCLIAAPVLIAVLLSGCGGPSKEERFAASVCATTLEGVRTLSDTFDQVRLTRAAPGANTRSTLVSLTERASFQTKSFGDELKRIPALDPSDPKPIETGWLRQFADQASDIMSESERRVNELPENPTLLQSVKAFQELESDIYRVLFLITTAPRAPDILETLTPELREAIERSESCKELDAETGG